MSFRIRLDTLRDHSFLYNSSKPFAFLFPSSSFLRMAWPHKITQHFLTEWPNLRLRVFCALPSSLIVIDLTVSQKKSHSPGSIKDFKSVVALPWGSQSLSSSFPNSRSLSRMWYSYLWVSLKRSNIIVWPKSKIVSSLLITAETSSVFMFVGRSDIWQVKPSFCISKASLSWCSFLFFTEPTLKGQLFLPWPVSSVLVRKARQKGHGQKRSYLTSSVVGCWWTMKSPKPWDKTLRLWSSVPPCFRTSSIRFFSLRSCKLFQSYHLFFITMNELWVAGNVLLQLLAVRAIMNFKEAAFLFGINILFGDCYHHSNNIRWRPIFILLTFKKTLRIRLAAMLSAMTTSFLWFWLPNRFTDRKTCVSS